MNKRPYSSCAVGKYIVNKHIETPMKFMGITKLIKLVYIAHGNFLDKCDQPLIRDPVEVWEYGPAIPDLYIEAKDRVSWDDWENALIEFQSDAEDIAKDSEAKEVIENILENYKEYSGRELTRLTHKNGTPWAISASCGRMEIRNALIKEYYRKINKKVTTSIWD